LVPENANLLWLVALIYDAMTSPVHHFSFCGCKFIVLGKISYILFPVCIRHHQVLWRVKNTQTFLPNEDPQRAGRNPQQLVSLYIKR
jgi:hypothetical protein